MTRAASRALPASRALLASRALPAHSPSAYNRAGAAPAATPHAHSGYADAGVGRSAPLYPTSEYAGPADTAETPQTPATPVTVEEVRARLASVADPEIPNVSIVDLGVVERVAVTRDAIEVELLPTFVGCPALEVIRASVVEALAPLGRPVSADFTWRVPWTSDRITPRGRERLAASGFAPPAEPAEVRCPYCESDEVAMNSAFGPTQCRSLFYCRSCRQPFEAFKPV